MARRRPALSGKNEAQTQRLLASSFPAPEFPAPFPPEHLANKIYGKGGGKAGGNILPASHPPRSAHGKVTSIAATWYQNGSSFM